MRFSKSPAWVMPGKYKTSSTEKTPPPNAYQLSRTRPSSPSWKIGNSQKCSYLPKSDTPGPGAYNSFSFTGTSFGIIHKPSKTTKNINKQLVGPGAYNPNYLTTKQSGNSFTMRQKLKPKYENQIPGPGQYNHQSTLSKTQTNIGKATRQWIQFDKSIPGPGVYNPNKIQTKSKGYLMGKEPRCQSAKPSTDLGPGQYQKTSIFQDQTKTNKGFTMSSKPPPPHPNQVPGPNVYSPNIGRSVRPTSAMQNKQKRFETKQNQYPGPGTYDERNYSPKNSKNSPSWSYGKQIKLKTTISDVPSPNTYNIPSYLSICNKS